MKFSLDKKHSTPPDPQRLNLQPQEPQMRRLAWPDDGCSQDGQKLFKSKFSEHDLLKGVGHKTTG